MRRNEVRSLILEDPPNGDLMEARIAVLETDVGHIKANVHKLQDGLVAANESLTQLKTGQAELAGRINTMQAAIESRINALETRIIKWMVTTGLGAVGTALTISKLMS